MNPFDDATFAQLAFYLVTAAVALAAIVYPLTQWLHRRIDTTVAGLNGHHDVTDAGEHLFADSPIFRETVAAMGEDHSAARFAAAVERGLS